MAGEVEAGEACVLADRGGPRDHASEQGYGERVCQPLMPHALPAGAHGTCEWLNQGLASRMTFERCLRNSTVPALWIYVGTDSDLSGTYFTRWRAAGNEGE
jgi:hypothetical protein